MTRILAACVAVLALVGTASAQGRRVFVSSSCGSHCAAPVTNYSYAAPVQQAYVAPVVAQPYAYPAAVAYQPIAVYVVPGTPTAAINVYPGTLSVIQPVPVQLNVTVAPGAAPATAGK